MGKKGGTIQETLKINIVTQLDNIDQTVKTMRDNLSNLNLGASTQKEFNQILSGITEKIKNLRASTKDGVIKFADQNPWLTAAEKYAVGNVVEGKVARMTDFGAFVELEPGVDALLHVSQISREHVEKPADVLKVGETITAKVVDFNEEDRKISLSIKAMEMPAKEENTEE